jgi:hypothetical protein
VRLTPAQWIELSTDGQTDFGAIGTVSTNPGVQGRQEDTLHFCKDFRIEGRKLVLIAMCDWLKRESTAQHQ